MTKNLKKRWALLDNKMICESVIPQLVRGDKKDQSLIPAFQATLDDANQQLASYVPDPEEVA